MSQKKKGIMPEDLKYEIAQEMGAVEAAKNHNYGELTSRQCGNMVKRALEKNNGKIRP